MIQINKKLPDKRSELLRLAVKDAIKISHDPRFRLYMRDWYTAFRWDDNTDKLVPRDVCEVCLAGSVMVCTLNVTPDKLENDIAPSYFTDLDIRKKLYLINELRDGTYDAELNNDIWVHKYTDEKCKVIKSAYKLISNNMDLDKGHAPWTVYFTAANMLESVGL